MVSEMSPTHFCPACRREVEAPDDEPELPSVCYGHARGEEGRHAI